MASEQTPLLLAIADLESRRAVLGEAAVNMAVAALRAEVARLAAVGAAPGTEWLVTDAGARLRQVSVLFVDVADSTALLQHATPEDAHQLIGVALERFAAVVQAAGGVVLRFMGDGLKAVFGAQGVREDEAERAVRAGLAILAAASHHAQQLQAQPPGFPAGTATGTGTGVAESAARIAAGLRFGVRVGIHSGPVLLGAGPEADRTAMGLAVHLAARMEQSAPVGCLRISHDTAMLVRGLFQMQAQPLLRVKGHDQPLQTWLVLGDAADADRAVQRGVEGVATAMVGREADLQALQALWRRCCTEPCSAQALVLADAGLGKTRLRHELQQALGATTLQARAHPADTLQPYGLLRQLVARWLDVGDDLHAEAARQRFVDGVLPWLRGASTTDTTTERSAALARAQRLGHLLGLDFGASPQVRALGARELRQQALATLAEALHRVAAQQPLLLVLDDVHWADDASLDALGHLTQPPAGAPPAALMLLLLARPTLLQRRSLPAPAAEAGPASLPLLLPVDGHVPSPLPALPDVQLCLHLQALTDEQGAALAGALLAGVQHVQGTLRQLLVARAQGNPYFMEELLRRLIADGVVNTATTPWQVHAERLQGLQLPQTLVGLLQARLDALPADELAALQHASIVGPVFWTTALAAVNPQAPAALPALQRHHAVTPQNHSAFANDTEHTFAHPLLHEVTYGTVLKAERTAGHGRTARWLAARTSGRAGEYLALTADHFERAGDAAMALDCYDRAQRDAMARFAHSAALALLDRALALQLPTLPARRRFLFHTRRQTALEHLGRAAESRAQQQLMADFAEAEDDDSMRADVAALRMLQADHEGRPDEARTLAQQALACVARHGGPTAMGAGALAHGELAWLALQAHDFAQVQRHIDAGLICARRCAEVPPQQGGYEGYELQLRTIEIDGRMRQARFVDSEAAVNRALAALVGLSRGFPLDRFHLLSLRCTIRRQLGDLDEAQQLADECTALAAQLEMPRMVAAALINVAEVALFSGQHGEVLQAADSVEKVAQQGDYPYLLPGVWRWRGDVAFATGQWATADDAWSRAATLMRAQQRAPDALQLRCLRALLAARAAASDAPALPAVQAVKDALAESAADARPHHGALEPAALQACHDVLAAAGDAAAPALRAALLARLQDQLAQLGSEADRARMLQNVPHWRAVAAWLQPAPA